MAEKLELPLSIVTRIAKDGAAESLAATTQKPVDQCQVIINQEAKKMLT